MTTPEDQPERLDPELFGPPCVECGRPAVVHHPYRPPVAPDVPPGRRYSGSEYGHRDDELNPDAS